MAYKDLLYDKSERVATITFNRPDRMNAWTRRMDGELREAMLDANNDPGVGAVIAQVILNEASPSAQTGRIQVLLPGVGLLSYGGRRERIGGLQLAGCGLDGGLAGAGRNRQPTVYQR